MGKINVLDQDTINKIAAGEVIERPASIVKELVENSIDAGATAITVELKDGGISLIRITDNGSGIDRDDIIKAFMPHATSKIRSADDLAGISSLGFRGEALASIAAVCQVELISKTRDAITGFDYRIEGGKEISMEDIGAPDGTTFLVRNIFFNTPARRKFLKTPQTEGNYILELVQHIALSAPDISFKVISQGQIKLSTTGNGKQKDVIHAIYGKEVYSNLIPVKLKKAGLTLSGFIGKPVINRVNKNLENFYVNGRYVKAKLIERAIEDAYKKYMMVHKHPFCVLMVNIPAELIDVNVHPAKLEIRFSQEELLYNEIYNYLSALLAGTELIQETTVREEKKTLFDYGKKQAEPFELMRAIREKDEASAGEGYCASTKTLRVSEDRETEIIKPESPPKKAALLLSCQEDAKKEAEPVCSRIKEDAIETKKTGNTESTDEIKTEAEKLTVRSEEKVIETEESTKEAAAVINTDAGEKPRLKPIKDNFTVIEPKKPEQLTLFDDRLLSKKARLKHRYLGQLFKTYLLIEYDDKLYMIDQHAAHEKVLYEQNMKRLKNRESGSKALVSPIVLNLSDRQIQAYQASSELFSMMGFDIEEFGANTYICRAIPDNMFGLDQTDLLYEMLDDMASEFRSKIPDTVVGKIATISCKAAVKGNMSLTDEEANALIDELLELENPYFCPHGRPSIISMTRTEMEKKFKRIV